ncbi:MAG: OmpH family outer membrane protein [Bacteroidetes bacterium]|nr:OmpH family outer membrane protein [Bacteroidota bacterium]
MNFKKLGLYILTLTILLFSYHFLFVKNSNISHFAYVDSQKLMKEYKGMLELNETLEQKGRELKASLDTLSMELQNDIKKYEKDRSSMSERERKTNEELIGRKQQQFFQYKASLEEKAKSENQKIVSSELIKINGLIAEFGKANGYSIIFGTTDGNILYANPEIEITNEVLLFLNNKYDSGK